VPSSGAKVVCDGKVDCDRWPLRLVLKGANSVRFTFKSDGSRTEWGYKFKVSLSAYLCLLFTTKTVVHHNAIFAVS
jgi:hypothetical protein